MFVTISTIRQLPQAFALGDSLSPDKGATTAPEPFLIGLADDPAHLPAGFVPPYPLLPLSTVLPADVLTSLSATYTPTEFAAACKPRFIAEVFKRYPNADRLLYADPNVLFWQSPTAVWEHLNGSNALLTPHITQPPDDAVAVGQSRPGPAWPDEKFFQNVGLYSADFMVFRRSGETDRLLAWWQDRVETRAYIDFCAGLCTDQLWLMHVPVFFGGVRIVKNPGWHVALWNLPERRLHPVGSTWQVDGPTGSKQPLLFVNAKGLFNADDGFFANQNRFRLSDRPDMRAVLTAYRSAVSIYANPGLSKQTPAYGQQPEPVVLRGWRRTVVRSMQAITRFVDQLPLPVFR